MNKICVLPRTQTSSSSNHCSTFRKVGSLITEVEIVGSQQTEWHLTLWRRSTLLRDKAIKLSKAKMHVYSDSELCLGRCANILPPRRSEKNKLDGSSAQTHHQALNGIDGAPSEFEWIIFQGHTTVELLRKMTTRAIKQEEFKDRIIFMSMYNDIDWSKVEESYNECFSNSLTVRDSAHRFPKGHRSFLGPGTEDKWYGAHAYKPEGKWNHSVDVMMCQFRRKRTSSFPSSVVDRGLLGQKGGKLSIHFNGDFGNVELLFAHNQFRQSSQYLHWLSKSLLRHPPASGSRK